MSVIEAGGITGPLKEKNYPYWLTIYRVATGLKCLTGLIWAAAGFCQLTMASDWPAWRNDSNHSAVSPAALPAELFVRWERHYPAPCPAWPDTRLEFDLAFQPVVAGKILVFGSSHEDTVVALDTDSGLEKWRFVTDGPVRLAPVIEKGRVYAVSDDGCLYCLDLATGRLHWKFPGCPTGQKLLGNERMISVWPARGGPVIHDGVVYFTAGIWPFMGVFVYALNAESGRVLWQNDRASGAYITQPGAGASTFGSVSPQGSLAVAGELLVVPSGRAWPAYFNLITGIMLPHALGVRATAGGGDSLIATSDDYLLMGGSVFSMFHQRSLVFNAPAFAAKPFAVLPVFDGKTLYGAGSNDVVALDLAGVKLPKPGAARNGAPLRCDATQLWKLPLAEPVKVMIKAGPRLYIGGNGWVASVETANDGGTTVSWRAAFEGLTAGLVAADDKLFVATREGSLYCFSSEHNPRRSVAPLKAQPSPTRSKVTRTIMEHCRVAEGYALLVGVGDEELAADLLQQTKLRLVVLEPDATRRDRLRDRFLAAGLYGERVTVMSADAGMMPPYAASLIVCGDPGVAAGLLFEKLHPFGGVLFFLNAPPPDVHTAGGALKQAGPFTVLTRDGGLPGAGDWTHDAADAGNTWMGQDLLVKAPLGVLWFGGEAGDPRLFMQRHSDPPGARVCQGRMFIHGDDLMTAVDVYTGRILWSRKLPAVRAYQNLRSNVLAGPPHEKAGETNKRAAFVAHPDGLYLAYGQTIHVWNPATGTTLAEFHVPAEDGSGSLYLGDLRLEGDVLVAGADFAATDVETRFVADDFRELTGPQLSETLQQVVEWAGGKRQPRNGSETDIEYLVRLTNQMLHDIELGAHVPAVLRQHADLDEKMKTALQSAEEAIGRQKEVQRDTFAPYLMIEHCNRQLLEACFPAIHKVPPKMNWSNLYPWDGAATRQLVSLDRLTGRLLWRQHGKYGFPQKSIAVGGSRVFCLDRTDLAVDDVLRRRGITQLADPRLLAFDLRTGKALWNSVENVLGYELFYSATNDILVQASAHDPAPELWWNKARDLSMRFVTYRGLDGSRVWDRTFTLNRVGGGHRLWHNWLLHKDTIILESYHDTGSDFYGFDLFTGATRQRNSALTGAEQPWGFCRMYGCNRSICCPNLVLFRSATAGYYDIGGDGGTSSLGGFRSGCKNSLIPAAGLLNAPNYASGCICNYPVFTSLALMHMPQVEQWSINTSSYDGKLLKRIGLNLGAPGDRRIDGGTLWLDFPSVGGPSPEIPVTFTPASVNWFYQHSSRIRGTVPGWIVASGCEGLEELQIRLCGKENAVGLVQHRYTVKLYFAEPNPIKAGERLFDVEIQGREVIRNLDIVAETGEHNIGLVKECRNVLAADQISFRLTPRIGKTLLCGVEIIAEE